MDGERLMQWRLPNWEPPQVLSNYFEQLTESATLTSVASQGDLVVVGMADGQVFSIENDQAGSLPSVGPASITALDISPNGNAMVVGTDSGEIYLVNLPRNELIRRELRAHDGSVSGLQFVDRGQLAVSVAGRDIKFWSCGGNSMKCLLTMEMASPVRSLQAGGDGNYLGFLLAGESGVRVWDLRTLKKLLSDRNVGW